MKTKTRTHIKTKIRTKKKTTRVTVDFPTAQHRKIKALAALEGITIQDFIRSRISTDIEQINISDKELKPIVKDIINENEDILKRLADK
jgi:hypothetical protein